jgi:hypothetical protein
MPLNLNIMKTYIPIFIFILSQLIVSGQRIGIGTDTPYKPLTVQGDVNNDLLGFKNNQGHQKWHWWMPGGNSLVLTESNVEDYRLTIKPGGSVGIGIDQPLEKLHVNGNLRVNQNLAIYGTARINSFLGPGSRYVGTNSTGELQVMTPTLRDIVSNQPPEHTGYAPLLIYNTTVQLIAGQAMFILSGTAYRDYPGLMQLELHVTQVEWPYFQYIMTTDVYANNGGMHMAFPSAQKTFNVLYGGEYIVHVNLKIGNDINGNVDFNDRINVSVIQF